LAVGGATALIAAGCGDTAPREPDAHSAADSSAHTADTFYADATATCDACADSRDPSDASDTDAANKLTGPSVWQQHAELHSALEAHVSNPAWFVDGHWQEHYGDAALYGPAYDMARFGRTGDEQALERALAALGVAREFVVKATGDFGFLLSETETAAMALLGILEAAVLSGDGLYLAEATALLNVVDSVAKGMDDYLALDAGGFASTTYGPTSLTAFVVLMHVEMAAAAPDTASPHLARAAEVWQAMRAKAWDEVLGCFRFAPDDARLDLYPNVLAMLALSRALLVDPRFPHRADLAAIRDCIEPLRTPGGYFRSLYSAKAMGAKTDDYATLSATNYTMLALWMAAGATGLDSPGGQALLADVHALLGFCETHLLEDGRLLHHWMDGAIAQPHHPSYYCTGCNLQSLLLLELLRQDRFGTR
jgi:hypothetical protein